MLLLRSIVLFAFAVCAAITPAAADDVADCKADNPELAIPACSKILQRKGLSARDRASGFARRGHLYMQRNQVDDALADASRAVEADPRYPGGYFVRGGAYLRKGASDRAMADFNRAIELDPKFVWGYYGRGSTYLRLSQFDRAIAEFNRALQLDPKNATVYNDRGLAYGRRGDLDRALADFRKAVELKPDYHLAMSNRAMVYGRKGEYERGIAEVTRVIELNPRATWAYVSRGSIYIYQGDIDRALADLNRAVDIEPRHSAAYSTRGRAFLEKGQLERALADVERALELDNQSSGARTTKGMVYARRGEIDPAIVELTKGIEFDPNSAEAYAVRGDLYLKKNQLNLAVADFRKVLALPARSPKEKEAQERVAVTMTQLTQGPPATQPSGPVTASAPAQPPQPGPPVAVTADTGGRRVALVIGNSEYAAVGRLKNPANDGRAIAAALRKVGFSEVIEKYDLGLAQMTAALKDFGDRAASADWAVIYFAGHGVEMGGTAYLVPTDAKIERDSHVPDETIPLDRMLQKAESAKKLRLIILDACRNNPFVTRMVRTGGPARAIGQGLPAIEVEGDVLVAYATKHGTTALDGSGDNSPFALALAQNIPTPNTDIRVMFGKVRDAVRKATANQQEPYTYGSIGGDLHYFASAAR